MTIGGLIIIFETLTGNLSIENTGFNNFFLGMIIYLHYRVIKLEKNAKDKK